MRDLIMAPPPIVCKMPSFASTTMFHARLDRLQALRTFLETFCTGAGLGADACLRLNVILEELFTNTVRHGHKGDCDAPVWVTLAAGAGKSVRVTYEDTAPPFNPYGKLPDVSPDTTIEMRKLGGLGVLLTRRLASSRDYSYQFGRNRIRLALTLD
jgi:serine/threonine-protein kinase RsbW